MLFCYFDVLGMVGCVGLMFGDYGINIFVVVVGCYDEVGGDDLVVMVVMIDMVVFDEVVVEIVGFDGFVLGCVILFN